MYKINVIDRNNQIIKLSWVGRVTPEDVKAANEELAGIFKGFRQKEFDFLVDMNDITVLLPETQKEIVKHQEWLLNMRMKRAAVIVSSNIAKLQLKRTARESSHEKEFHFSSEAEALSFLIETPVAQ